MRRLPKKNRSKTIKPFILLFAVAAIVVITLQLAILQNLSSPASFDATLNIKRAYDHMSPNNLFANNEKHESPSNSDASVTPTDAQLKLIRMAKERGLHNADDKGPILEILVQAGIQIENKNELDQETLDLLPTWTQIQKLYGSEPKIQGLERCEDFRIAVEPSARFFGMAGTFNTGTNLIHDLMRYNCQNTERMKVFGDQSKGVRWQVAWGKHFMARYRGSEHTTRTDSDVPHENILPLVAIRDPYSWMHSMCRHKYAANWPHLKDHCPNLIATEADINALPYLRNLYVSDVEGGNQEKLVPVVVNHSKEDRPKYLSLAHFYSEWYEDYFKADYPRIMVRFEDLLFYGEKVIRALCDCGGGVSRLDNGRNGLFAHVSESAKKGATAHGAMAERTNLVGALIKYGSFAHRTDLMTNEDLKAARHHLDPEIMKAFGYRHPALPKEEMEHQIEDAAINGDRLE